MDDASFTRLYKSVQLKRFFWSEARRYFRKDEDLQEDAVSEAWKKVLAQPAGLGLDDYKKHGTNAILAMYRRVLRRRKKEAPADLGEAGEALRALTKKAVDGDW